MSSLRSCGRDGRSNATKADLTASLPVKAGRTSSFPSTTRMKSGHECSLASPEEPGLPRTTSEIVSDTRPWWFSVDTERSFLHSNLSGSASLGLASLFLGTIDAPPMSNPDPEHQELVIDDFVDHPVAPHPQTPKTREFAFHLSCLQKQPTCHPERSGRRSRSRSVPT